MDLDDLEVEEEERAREEAEIAKLYETARRAKEEQERIEAAKAKAAEREEAARIAAKARAAYEANKAKLEAEREAEMAAKLAASAEEQRAASKMIVKAEAEEAVENIPSIDYILSRVDQEDERDERIRRAALCMEAGTVSPCMARAEATVLAWRPPDEEFTGGLPVVSRSSSSSCPVLKDGSVDENRVVPYEELLEIIDVDEQVSVALEKMTQEAEGSRAIPHEACEKYRNIYGVDPRQAALKWQRLYGEKTHAAEPAPEAFPRPSVQIVETKQLYEKPAPRTVRMEERLANIQQARERAAATMASREQGTEPAVYKLQEIPGEQRVDRAPSRQTTAWPATFGAFQERSLPSTVRAGKQVSSFPIGAPAPLRGTHLAQPRMAAVAEPEEVPVGSSPKSEHLPGMVGAPPAKSTHEQIVDPNNPYRAISPAKPKVAKSAETEEESRLQKALVREQFRRPAPGGSRKVQGDPRQEASADNHVPSVADLLAQLDEDEVMDVPNQRRVFD
eukprot:gnl/TRDRNA2_/TRDRNA2_189278_c0_seq1.p1 gnl/TRDRNA2_/TRDRNA2_189278_c0~~gnl/TRDRNA2_/TRDRNA2_189278_c0_seq1.p1  ORF type:complete len:506 (-),score=124.81 gnl/TRDRNA2_/TRDRNA2_189278_c0_seq1:42-1559(-)